MNSTYLICSIGWEERCEKGILSLLATQNVCTLLALRYDTEDDLTSNNFESIKSSCAEKGINLKDFKILNGNHPANWRTVEIAVAGIPSDARPIVDISVMSRNLIWTLLFFLSSRFSSCDYFYHKPEEYATDWLGRDPENPRLLYKHSGLIDIGKSTCLIMVTGFDPERTKYALNFFEPSKVVLLIQNGNQFNNTERNHHEAHLSQTGYSINSNVEVILCDFYANDGWFDSVNSKVEENADAYNVILLSHGPKVSAIELYKIFLKRPEVALAYVPMREYNRTYSQGLGATIEGCIEFKIEAHDLPLS